MIEDLRQSPLHPSLLDGPHHKGVEHRTRAVTIRALGPRRFFALRARDPAPLAASLRERWPVELPCSPNRSAFFPGGMVVWWSPDEWLLSLDDPGISPRLPPPLGGAHVVDLTGGLVAVEVAGPDPRALLGAGCWLDFHPRAFHTGDAAQTLLAKANVTVVMTNDAPVYEVVVRRSFAPYLWRWLCHAADVVV